MLGKLFERRYFHSDSRLVPSGEGPPVTSGDCLLSISGLFAEVASRSLCSHAKNEGLCRPQIVEPAYENENRGGMALMHDYVRRANFTTKPRLRGIFSAFALFVRGYSFKFTALGHSFMQNFATLQFKTRLGGEICSLDVNMHKGYVKSRGG